MRPTPEIHQKFTKTFQAIGPLAGQCDGVEFEKEGSQLTANNLNNCGISGAEYDAAGIWVWINTY